MFDGLTYDSWLKLNLMAELYFKRVLHPVGQGAFFTEQFFDGDNTIFNVVYDCGELIRGAGTSIQTVDTTYSLENRYLCVA